MITINANGQILSMCQCDQLVSDSIDVLEVQFIFDSAWAGMVKTAQFTQKNKDTKAFDTYNVLIDDMGMAYVPNEITDGVCIISVFGVLGGKRLTSAKLAVSVLKSGYVPDGITPIPPTPDLYQQLLEEFQASSYELPAASAEMLGGVKVGQGLAVAADGTLLVTGGGVADSVEWANVTGKPETFPPSEHKHHAGDMDGLAEVATTGNYEDLENLPTIPQPYELPTASAETLGGVKVGQGLAVAADGTLLVTDVPWANVTGKPETFPVAMELLWENADISSDFAGQNITITNKSDYKFFIVTMQPNGTTLTPGNCVSAIVLNGAGNTLLGIVESKLARRRVVATWATALQIGTGYTFDEYGSAMVESTSVMKPVYIYGAR